MMHDKLVKLASENFQEIKVFEAKIFESKDFEDFLYHSIMLIEEAKKTETKISKFSGYSSRMPKRLQFQRHLVIKENLLLSVGAEYLIRAIFLKRGYGLNLHKEEPKSKLYSNDTVQKSDLDVTEVLPFEFLKANLEQVMDLSDFDKRTYKKNKILQAEENSLYRPKSISTRLHYKKPNSQGCLNFIQGLRNNYTHKPQIKSQFSGFFRDALEFLDYLSLENFGNGTTQLYKEYKPEKVEF